MAVKCLQQTARCYHCKGEHQTGSRICPEYKYQDEILAIQSREGVSRGQAKVLLDKLSPNFVMNYAAAVKSTENKDKQSRHNQDDNPRTYS